MSFAILIVNINVFAISPPYSMSCTFQTPPLGHTPTMCEPTLRGVTELLFEATLGHNPSATG